MVILFLYHGQFHIPLMKDCLFFLLAHWCTILNVNLETHSSIPRTYSSSLMHAIIASNYLPFLKSFQFLYVLHNFLNIFTLFHYLFAHFLKNRNHALTFWKRPWCHSQEHVLNLKLGLTGIQHFSNLFFYCT